MAGRVDDGEVESGKDAAYADQSGQDVTIGIAPGDIGKVLDGTALLRPAVTETEMEKEDQDPGLEDNGSNNGDKPLEDDS